MNKLSTSKGVQVLAALVEGKSVNVIVRMTSVAKHTILKPLEDMGCAYAAYHHRHGRRRPCYRFHKTPAMEAGLADHVGHWKN